MKKQKRSGQAQQELESAGSPLLASMQLCGHVRVSGMGFILSVHTDRASEKVLGMLHRVKALPIAQNAAAHQLFL